MLVTEDLSLEYLYGAKALSDVSFEIASGEHVAVLGGAEAGKTSLLKAIAGLYPVSSGKISIDGKDVTEAKIKDREILFVYDDGGLFNRRTVRYNLIFPQKVRKVPKAEREIRAVDAADGFGLGGFEEEYVFRLYETEKVRLALARTALRKSSLVMIDDVFAMLPSAQRGKLFRELFPRIAEINSSLLFATSSVTEAFSVGKRVIFLRYGRVEQIGSPEELIGDPASVNVDAYVNVYRNFTEAPVTLTADGAKLNFGGYEINVSCPGYKSDRVIISYVPEPAEDGEPFEAVSRTFDGKGFVYLNADGIKFPADESPPAGIKVRPRKSDLRIFSVTDEKRLTFRID